MYNKFAMNLSKFKKIGSDKEYTTMQHEDGHVMKIAHKALTPKMRTEIKKMPSHKKEDMEAMMAEGGEVEKRKAVADSIAKAFKVKKDEPASEPKKESPKQEPHGEWVERGTDENKRNAVASSMTKAFAEGGDIMPEGQDEEPAPQAAATPALPSPQMPQQPPAMPPQPEATPPSQGLAPQATAQQPEASPPSTMGALQHQSEGILGQAQAEAQQAQEQQKALVNQASTMNDMMEQYQNHVNDLETERKAFQDDIINKHIDPNKYLGSMDTGARFDTAIGLILGGLGGGGSSNAAQDFLNKQIDRDIDAQKAELGKKETLLSANLRQFGNLRDATEMTKVMQNDILINKLKAAEAKATSPIAKARAQQQIGVLEAQVAPIVQKQATRQMLSQMSQDSSLSKADPSIFVESMVPEGQQKEVAKEIDEAKEITKNKDKLLRNFEESAKDNTILKTGFGKVREPGSVKELKALILPQFKNIDGTVREYAAEQAFHNFIPSPGDSAPTVEHKRRALLDWMVSKQGGSLSKAHGIDLSKFEATGGNAGDSASASRAPAVQEVERIGKDGKIAIFDAATKKFLRYK